MRDFEIQRIASAVAAMLEDTTGRGRRHAVGGSTDLDEIASRIASKVAARVASRFASSRTTSPGSRQAAFASSVARNIYAARGPERVASHVAAKLASAISQRVLKDEVFVQGVASGVAARLKWHTNVGKSLEVTDVDGKE